MFIGNPKPGLETRMSDQEIHSYLEDVSDMAECRRFYRDTGDEYYLTRVRTLHDSLKRRISYVLRNHPRPRRCDCGNYPEIVPVGLVGSHIGIGCLKCGKKLGKDFLYKAFNSKNEAFIAWNSMLAEEHGKIKSYGIDDANWGDFDYNND